MMCQSIDTAVGGCIRIRPS